MEGVYIVKLRKKSATSGSGVGFKRIIGGFAKNVLLLPGKPERLDSEQPRVQPLVIAYRHPHYSICKNAKTSRQPAQYLYTEG